MRAWLLLLAACGGVAPAPKRDDGAVFAQLVRDRHDQIASCRAAAVAENAALAETAIEVMLVVPFDDRGTAQQVSTSPYLGAAFQACIDQVAASWKLTLSKAAAFSASVTLPPPVPLATPVEPDPPKPLNAETARVAAMEFLDRVSRSRADIERCFATLVATDPAIKSRSVELAISATFDDHGAFARLALSPRIGVAFEDCVQAIVSSWTLTLTQQMSFKASLRLSSP